MSDEPELLMHFGVLGDSQRESSYDRDIAQSSKNPFPRISRTPGVMGGKPCVRGSRMTVGMILGQLSEGASFDELMEDFPELERDDINQALGYAGWYSNQMLFDLSLPT